MKIKAQIMLDGLIVGNWEVPQHWDLKLMDRIIVRNKPFDIIGFRPGIINVWTPDETEEQEEFWRKAT